MCVSLPVAASAADTWLRGNLADITSTPHGLLIKLDTGIPGNCYGNAYNWMLIPEANRTMIATALMTWYSTTKTVDVYTFRGDDRNSCIVEQFDPK